jgi:hypothetical protein
MRTQDPRVRARRTRPKKVKSYNLYTDQIDAIKELAATARVKESSLMRRCVDALLLQLEGDPKNLLRLSDRSYQQSPSAPQRA